MKMLQITAACSIAALSACDTPTPPTITQADVLAAQTEVTRVGALSITANADLPPGSATYAGQLGAVVTGDEDGSILGDMSIIVAFDTGTIGGTVDNINIIDDDGIPNQLLGGNLTIAGSESNGSLSATASGSLTAVGDISIRGSSDVTLAMLGDTRTDVTNGDTVSGVITGGFSSGDFELTATSGSFYGTQAP